MLAETIFPLRKSEVPGSKELFCQGCGIGNDPVRMKDGKYFRAGVVGQNYIIFICENCWNDLEKVVLESGEENYEQAK